MLTISINRNIAWPSQFVLESFVPDDILIIIVIKEINGYRPNYNPLKSSTEHDMRRATNMQSFIFVHKFQNKIKTKPLAHEPRTAKRKRVEL